ncbi:hypothetical protein [Halocynthiibacter sp.]|uniref:hypothetical protein n=1 Tax=Halocynthiibacter sp. TaxID=1979210 RepID=UPI003C66CE5E
MTEQIPCAGWRRVFSFRGKRISGLIIGLIIGIVFTIGTMFKSRPFLTIIAGFSLTLAGFIATFYLVPDFAEEIPRPYKYRNPPH